MRSVELVFERQPGAELLHGFRTDAFDPLKIVDASVGPVSLTVFDNAVGQHLADALQLDPLDPSRRVHLQPEIKLVLHRPLDFNRMPVPAAEPNSVADHLQQRRHDKNTNDQLIAAAEPEMRFGFVTDGGGPCGHRQTLFRRAIVRLNIGKCSRFGFATGSDLRAARYVRHTDVLVLFFIRTSPHRS